MYSSFTEQCNQKDSTQRKSAFKSVISWKKELKDQSPKPTYADLLNMNSIHKFDSNGLLAQSVLRFKTPSFSNKVFNSPYNGKIDNISTGNLIKGFIKTFGNNDQNLDVKQWNAASEEKEEESSLKTPEKGCGFFDKNSENKRNFPISSIIKNKNEKKEELKESEEDVIKPRAISFGKVEEKFLEDREEEQDNQGMNLNKILENKEFLISLPYFLKKELLDDNTLIGNKKRHRNTKPKKLSQEDEMDKINKFNEFLQKREMLLKCLDQMVENQNKEKSLIQSENNQEKTVEKNKNDSNLPEIKEQSNLKESYDLSYIRNAIIDLLKTIEENKEYLEEEPTFTNNYAKPIIQSNFPGIKSKRKTLSKNIVNIKTIIKEPNVQDQSTKNDNHKTNRNHKTKKTKNKPNNNFKKPNLRPKERKRAKPSPDAKEYPCDYCKQIFYSGQALGGHMSRKHPNLSEKFYYKTEVRNQRTQIRDMLVIARKQLLNVLGYNYEELNKSNEGKQAIKRIVRENQTRYRHIVRFVKAQNK